MLLLCVTLTRAEGITVCAGCLPFVLKLQIGKCNPGTGRSLEWCAWSACPLLLFVRALHAHCVHT